MAMLEEESTVMEDNVHTQGLHSDVWVFLVVAFSVTGLWLFSVSVWSKEFLFLPHDVHQN